MFEHTIFKKYWGSDRNAFLFAFDYFFSYAR